EHDVGPRALADAYGFLAAADTGDQHKVLIPLKVALQTPPDDLMIIHNHDLDRTLFRHDVYSLNQEKSCQRRRDYPVLVAHGARLMRYGANLDDACGSHRIQGTNVVGMKVSVLE